MSEVQLERMAKVGITTEQHPTHTFPEASARYPVKLTVTDRQQQSSIATLEQRVLLPPIASFSFTPTTPDEGQNVIFLPSAHDPDGGKILGVRTWQWGDGRPDSTWPPGPDAHAFFDNGTYNVTLQVVDDQEQVGVIQQTVAVNNLPPTIYVDQNHYRTMTQETPFDARWGVKQWVAAPNMWERGVRVSDLGRLDTPFVCTWDYGDGQTTSVCPTPALPEHAYARPGTYQATLTATDKDGASTSKQFTIIVRKHDTLLTITSGRTGTTSGPREVVAKLEDLSALGASLTGKTVIFTLGHQHIEATVGSDGVARATMTFASNEQNVLTASFAGDDLYHPALDRPSARGDIFAALGAARIRQYSAEGALIREISTPEWQKSYAFSQIAGMCFDASGSMYATNFGRGIMASFDTMGGIIEDPWGGPFSRSPESCVLDAKGNVYTGEVDGEERIRKFDANGTLLQTVKPITARGADWIDLAADQCTMFYASEDDIIRRFDVCKNTQLPPFALGVPGKVCYALRIRANGEVMVACTTQITRLDAQGKVIQTYPAAQYGADYLFAMNLDPDGTSFWTGDLYRGDIYKIDIASGRQLSTIHAPAGPLTVYTPGPTAYGATGIHNVPSSVLGGLAIFGEPTAAQNDAPVANAGADQEVKTGTVVTLDGSGSTDPDPGTTLTYAWKQLAGSTVTLTGATTAKPTFTPTEVGTYTFELTVSDGYASDTDTVDIVVEAANTAPVASGQNVTTPEDTPKAITLSATDADGNALTYTVVTKPEHGTLSGTAPDLTYTPNANYHGPDSLTFKANDGTLDSNTATVSITVSSVNDPPVAKPQVVTTAEDTAKPITLGATDADGDALTYTIVTQPGKGTLTGTAPNLTYTPAKDVNGADSFTITANDGTVDSTTATVSITLTPVNDGPTASGGTTETDEDVAVTLDLTALVSDLETADADLSYVIDTQPTKGTLSGSGGKLTYTPKKDVNGTDSFTYHVVDRGDPDTCGTANASCSAALSSAIKTVTITIHPVNDAPSVSNDGPKAATQYSDPIDPVTVTATDVDTPVSSLTATTSWKKDTGSFTTSPALPSGLTLSAGSTAGTWKLDGMALIAAGTYTIRVAVSDGALTSETDITLEVTPEDATIEYSGDTLRATASADNTSTASVSLAGIIREAADASLGSKLPGTQLKFTVYKYSDTALSTPVTSCTGTVASTGSGTGTASCTATLTADNYTVKVELVTNAFYTAPVETQAVTVVQPGTGMSTGGGWLDEPKLKSRSNFGFTVKYLKSGGIQGNSLYIYRQTVAANTIPLPDAPGTYLPAGEYNWIIKSNAMSGLTQSCTTTTPKVCTARFTGKNTISAVDRSSGVAYSLGGNYQFQVDVTDNGEPGSSNNTTPDTYALRVWDTATGTYYQLGTATAQVALNGGNIQVKP